MSSFAFIPRSVKKKNYPLVSGHTPSASISVGAQVTSESTLPSNPKGTTYTSSETVNKKRKTEDDKKHSSTSVAGTQIKPSQATTAIAAQKASLDLEDLAQLVCLALSDYAIWADVDLRRKIDWANDQDPYDDATELSPDDDNKGYIPLAYLLRHSQIFRLASASSSPITSQPQTTFIKAIRTHASHLIDARLIIPSSSSKNDTSQWTVAHIQTGYELRRKETSSALSNHGKKEWDALTIYVENIPNQYRSIPGIPKFLNRLLPPSSRFSNSSFPRIQNISLPSHHQDEPDSIPICKSFALVTLSHYEDVTALLKAWPWDHSMDAINSDRPTVNDVKSTILNAKNKGKDGDHLDEEFSSFHVEAAKFGLRVLTKGKWEELRAEYLLYHQELVDEINRFQDEDHSGVYGGGVRKRGYGDEAYDQEEQISLQTDQVKVKSNKNAAVPTAGLHLNSMYPPGCLVFVRNVHPDTNKTTLRTLFLHACESSFENEFGSGKKDEDGLDYLDYTKGMDCCHVRLRTPLHAQQLVYYLSSKSIVQISGLDGSGTSLAHLSSLDKDKSQLKPILAEEVLGKREEVYWEKVPEKIRRQAVEKALSLLHSNNGSGSVVGNALIAGPSEGDTTKMKEHQTQSVDFNIHAHSAYPPGCLVFIRNVHPETNKTTLRNLFLHVREEEVESEDPDGNKDGDGIDYLDYTKGMDCCHVRLRTPLHAQQLVHHLSSNSIVQTTGLDASGSRLASSSDNRVDKNSAFTSQLKPLVAEQVLGKREEVYWEKVPEKVRRQAVEKALSFLHGGDGCSGVEVLESSKPKKRRKK